MNHVETTMVLALLAVWTFVLGTKWVKADKNNRRRGYQKPANKNGMLVVELILLVAVASFVLWRG